MALLENITKNLPSLQFEAGLKDDEKALLYLRSRNLAVISSACGQAAYFVSILNEARKTIFEKPNYKSLDYKPLKIGIIGCGRLGKQLTTVLLEFANTDPSNLYISTRCPENLVQFENRGVTCCFNNRMVSDKVDVLFLCCLPSQLNTVAKDLRGRLVCLVYSLIGGMSLAKISQLLDYKQIIKPNFVFKPLDQEKSDSNPLSFGRDITEVLRDPVCCQHTSPFHINEVASLLEDDEKLCELFVLAFLNQCTAQGISNHESVRLCNSVMFGLELEHSSCLTVEDFLQDNVEIGKEECLEKGCAFPVFNLTEIYSSETLLGKKLNQSNGVLRKAFVTSYGKVFEKTGEHWLYKVTKESCCRKNVMDT